MKNAASSASMKKIWMWLASRFSACSPSSTAARKAAASPFPTAPALPATKTAAWSRRYIPRRTLKNSKATSPSATTATQQARAPARRTPTGHRVRRCRRPRPQRQPPLHHGAQKFFGRKKHRHQRQQRLRAHGQSRRLLY